MKKRRSVHFVGIGGIGISALARGFLAQKWNVTGSDATTSTVVKELKKEGVSIAIGHKKSNVPKDADLVIYTQAMPHNNPELVTARRLGVATLSYPEAVGHLTEQYKTIAIAGAHGKSTTTALVSLILKKARLDPTVIVGTKLKELHGKNFAQGKSEYLVLEADEYKEAFLHYSPFVLLITNIDREHLDVFKTLARVKQSFLNAMRRVREGGVLVLNKDNENLYSLKKQVQGIAKKNHLTVLWYSTKQKESKRLKRYLQLPGEHNLSNALGALTVAKVLKVDEDLALRALALYEGSWRRFDYRGLMTVKKGLRALVYDDYGHHPTEIKATLASFHERYPNAKIVCVFEPHQAKRLKDLFKEFTDCFGQADVLVLLPIFQVTGRDAISKRYDSENLARLIQHKNKPKLTFYLKNKKSIKAVLTTLLKNDTTKVPPVVVMMGAGTIFELTNSLLH
jgi:UDP-N-acetylmuramate--alanine ligase